MSLIPLIDAAIATNIGLELKSSRFFKLSGLQLINNQQQSLVELTHLYVY